MLDIIFIPSFILFPVIMLIIVKACDIDLFYPSILSVIIWTYIAFAYVGILPLYYFWNDYHYNLGVISRDLILKLWAFTSLPLFCIVLSFAFCRYLFKIRINFRTNFENKVKKVNKLTTICICILFLLCIFVLFIYLSKLPEIPLVSAIKGSESSTLSVLRSISGNDFEGKQYRYSLFYSQILPFLSYILFAKYLNSKAAKDFIFFSFIFIICLFSKLMQGLKSPAIIYLLGICIVYLLVRHKRITFIKIIIACIFGMTLLVLSYSYFMGMNGRPLSDIIMAILSRAFAGSIVPAYFYLYIFPQYHDYLLGSSLPNPGGIFPWEHYKITVEVMNFINPQLSEQGIVGSAPTVFWAEIYANFGIGGILISSFFVGIMLYLIQYFIKRFFSSNPISIGFEVWLILELHKLTITGISILIFNINIIVITLITIFLLNLNNWEYNKSLKSNTI